MARLQSLLSDKTSFNRKSRKGEVRVNCKAPIKTIIENKTRLKMIGNSAGDSTRDYSLLVGNQDDLDKVLEALGFIAENANKS